MDDLENANNNGTLPSWNAGMVPTCQGMDENPSSFRPEVTAPSSSALVGHAGVDSSRVYRNLEFALLFN